MIRRTCPALLAALLAAFLAVPAGARAPAGARPPATTVTLVDIAFVPSHLVVRRGTVVRWRWSSANFEHHRLVLVRGPRGVGPLRSRGAVKNFTFSRRLTRPGRYRFVCSYHPKAMRQTIVVR